MAGNSQQQDSWRSSRLESEAVCLFGRQIVERSRTVSLEDMAAQASKVREAARMLREQTGKPERQRAIVRGLDEKTALTLCRWLRTAGADHEA